MDDKNWTVHIHITEDGDDTVAEAVLTTPDTSTVTGRGAAHRNPVDRPVPEIGDELAACRALFGLAQDLLEASVADVAANDPAGDEPLITLD